MEEWRPIEGFPAYEVSSLSRVRRTKDGKRTYAGRILKPGLTSAGYLTVCLYENCKAQTHEVHRLLAKAFIPNPENKYSVDHVNGVKTDNRIENLRWSTHQENMRNRPKYRNNTTGYLGVSFYKNTGKFRAHIFLEGKLRHLGYFLTAAEAGLVASAARRKAFGEFYNANT